MRAVVAFQPGGPEVLQCVDRPRPKPAPTEVCIDVRAAGVNRPDCLQRQGRYRPPPGTTDILGLEAAGVVSSVGEQVSRFQVGDAVMALLAGGGYAEVCVAPEAQCLPMPKALGFIEASALPETWCTVWANLFEAGHLASGELTLIHGGSSGIGHTAIQLATARGSRVATTSGSDSKVDFCSSLGSQCAVNYRTHDFVEALRDFGPVDVVLDMVGGSYLARNIEVLGHGGRIVHIAALEGGRAELPIFKMMAKQAVLTGSFLRPRSVAEKGRLLARVESELLPLLDRAKPHVSAQFALSEASKAHAALEAGEVLGKAVLVMD